MMPADERDEREDAPRADDLGFSLPQPAKVSKTRIVALGALGAAVVGGAFLFGWMPKKMQRAELVSSVSGTATAPRVEVVAPKEAKTDRAVVLPGSVQPLEETVIYPRASGYVHKWYVDIGEDVKEGALLAEIDTPELDQQLAQARAELAKAQASVVQAKAGSEFAKQDLARYQQLTPQGIASKQDLDQRQANAAVADANVRVAEASVTAQQAAIARLVQMKSFARVVAPFDGTVTARTVERGALVTAGTGAPLFKVAATKVMRVFVQTPQDVAPNVRIGLGAKVTVREFAGRVFEGTVAHAAGALDATSRTMTTEIRVPNDDRKLLPGMYAEVSLGLPTPHRVLELPATALLVDAHGVRVATVGPDAKVHLVPVTVDRDTGPTIEVSSGLQGSERVVKLGSAELTEGRSVDVVP